MVLSDLEVVVGGKGNYAIFRRAVRGVIKGDLNWKSVMTNFSFQLSVVMPACIQKQRQEDLI